MRNHGIHIQPAPYNLIDMQKFLVKTSRTRPLHPKKAIITTQAVSHAVFNGAYDRGLIPSQIKRIWRLAGDNLCEADLEGLFSKIVSGTSIRFLLMDGYQLTGERVLMNSGRRCVAIRVLSEMLYHALKAERGANTALRIEKTIAWSTFTYEVLSHLCMRGFADEGLAAACLEIDIGL